jgi:hypothetical protein
MTEKQDCLPNFLGVGAGKTATTWLHACLDEHPDVFMPGGIEVDFFSKHYQKGLSWYQNHFVDVDGQKAIGDISPSYMVFPEALSRIYEWNPQVRLIFSFRNPVKRAYSHYCMHLRGGVVSREIEDEITVDTRYVREGLYFRHLKRFLDHFPEESILVLLYDDLVQAPGDYLRQVFSFLEVDTTFEPSLLNERYHHRKPIPRFQRLYNLMIKLVRYARHHSKLARNLIEAGRRRGYFGFVHRLNAGEDFPEMPRDKQIELAEYYWEEVLALGAWLDRDLSHWLIPYLESNLKESKQ